MKWCKMIDLLKKRFACDELREMQMQMIFICVIGLFNWGVVYEVYTELDQFYNQSSQIKYIYIISGEGILCMKR